MARKKHSKNGNKTSNPSKPSKHHKKSAKSGRGREETPSRPVRYGNPARQAPAAAKINFDVKDAVEATKKKMQEWRAQALLPKTPRPGLDPWQEQACNILHEGGSVVVDAPTSAGKTRVVESFFAAHIHKPGFRAAYTTPVKSLSNDKVRELRALFGAENVGIATGDIKENLNAPIVVATLESYRNSLLGTEPDLGRTLVVFDEYH
ncbi:MAG: DEAD/DEAH box helicase, partial [Proteobacteria bacterium]|nr:DEAD/DEAH box helicase [Pseudomonadota bacterium]